MAHNLKIAGAEYADVSKVTFTDTFGASEADVTLASGQPNDTYLLWVESI